MRGGHGGYRESKPPVSRSSFDISTLEITTYDESLTDSTENA